MGKEEPKNNSQPLLRRRRTHESERGTDKTEVDNEYKQTQERQHPTTLQQQIWISKKDDRRRDLKKTPKPRRTTTLENEDVTNACRGRVGRWCREQLSSHHLMCLHCDVWVWKWGAVAPDWGVSERSEK